MTEKKDHHNVGAELRNRAEEQLGANSVTNYFPETAADPLQLLHELQVHQIELEMQNAELRQARDKAEDLLDKYTDLYDSALVGYLTLDREGTIHTANLTGASLLGIERSRLIGLLFGLLVTDDARPIFTAFLERVFTRQRKESCEVALLKQGNLLTSAQMVAKATASGQECCVVLIDLTEIIRVKEQDNLIVKRTRQLQENQALLQMKQQMLSSSRTWLGGIC
jgi:PAS domain S-box-containing protein